MASIRSLCMPTVLGALVLFPTSLPADVRAIGTWGVGDADPADVRAIGTWGAADSGGRDADPTVEAQAGAERLPPFRIHIVYPHDKMSVPAIDRMFVFGSVHPPNARVYINGLDSPLVQVSTGGWLGMIPIRAGKFTITARAVLETGEETSDVRRIVVAKGGGADKPNAAGSPGELDLGLLAVHKPPAERELRPARTGRLTADTVYLRSGPNVGDDQAGYEMRLQKNVLVTLVAQIDKTYRVKLSDLESLWIDENAVRLLPKQSPAPQSRINAWTVRRNEHATQISTRVEELLPYRVTTSPDGRSLTLRIYGGISNTDWMHHAADDPWIRQVRWSHPIHGVYQLDVDLRRPVWGYDIRYEKRKLILEFRDPPDVRAIGTSGVGDADPPVLAPARRSGRQQRPPAPTPSLDGLKVCVDPGHPPMGATGPLGIAEHAVNWMMAVKLKDALSELGAMVVLSRQDNETLPLHERVDRARAADADLFVSVHANALPVADNPFEKNGFSVYYYQPFSLELAESVHQSLRDRIPLRDDGLHYGNLHVIRQSAMPSILVECGYLMWPPEEELLLDPVFQGRFASAVVSGIATFLEQRLPGRISAPGR